MLGSCARASQQQITLHLLDALELRGTKDTRSPLVALIGGVVFERVVELLATAISHISWLGSSSRCWKYRIAYYNFASGVVGWGWISGGWTVRIGE